MVSLGITTHEVDGATIVTLTGRIVFGEGSNALRSTVKSLIAEGKQKIVLNMRSIEHIDSPGLGMLVAAHISMKAHASYRRRMSVGRNPIDAIYRRRRGEDGTDEDFAGHR